MSHDTKRTHAEKIIELVLIYFPFFFFFQQARQKKGGGKHCRTLPKVFFSYHLFSLKFFLLFLRNIFSLVVWCTTADRKYIRAMVRRHQSALLKGKFVLRTQELLYKAPTNLECCTVCSCQATHSGPDGPSWPGCCQSSECAVYIC